MADNDEVVIVLNQVNGSPLVIGATGAKSTSGVITSTVPGPVPVAPKQLAGHPITIGSAGPQGPPGPAGAAGSGGGGGGTQNVFIQNTAPVSPPAQYLWIQDGLGSSGTDMTFWVMQ